MFGLGDNLIIEFQGVSWLLWLHLLVMFLLFILLGILGFHATEDRPGGSTSAGHFTSIDHPEANQVQNYPCNSGSNCSQDTKTIKFKMNASRRSQVSEDLATIKGHLTTSTRTKLKVEEVRDDEEEIEEMEDSSMVVNQRTVMQFCVNPCYYMAQVLKPFLKCLGLHSTYQDSSTTKQGRNTKKL